MYYAHRQNAGTKNKLKHFFYRNLSSLVTSTWFDRTFKFSISKAAPRTEEIQNQTGSFSCAKVFVIIAAFLHLHSTTSLSIPNIQR